MTTLHLPHIRKPPPDLFSSHRRITLRHYPLVSHQQYHLAKHPRVLDGPYITAVAYLPGRVSSPRRAPDRDAILRIVHHKILRQQSSKCGMVIFYQCRIDYIDGLQHRSDLRFLRGSGNL